MTSISFINKSLLNSFFVGKQRFVCSVSGSSTLLSKRPSPQYTLLAARGTQKWCAEAGNEKCHCMCIYLYCMYIVIHICWWYEYGCVNGFTIQLLNQKRLKGNRLSEVRLWKTRDRNDTRLQCEEINLIRKILASSEKKSESLNIHQFIWVSLQIRNSQKSSKIVLKFEFPTAMDFSGSKFEDKQTTNAVCNLDSAYHHSLSITVLAPPRSLGSNQSYFPGV